MTTNWIRTAAAAAVAALALLAPWSAARAIDPADEREFEEVFVIGATAPARDRVGHPCVILSLRS